MNRRSLLLPGLWLAFWFLPASASAHGTIEGSVRLAGEAPALPQHSVVKDNAVCGATKPNEAVLVGPGGTLGNVVVSLRLPKPASPPPPTSGAAVDQVGCTYKPHVQAVTVGTSLTLVNSDRVLHNIHGSIGPVQTFNVAMPIKDQRLPTKLTRPGLVRLQCDAGHAWMNAWLYVFEHPYFAVTGADGRFEIKDVPAGHYTLELWHEPTDGKGAGVTSILEVDVNDGVPTKADTVIDLRGP